MFICVEYDVLHWRAYSVLKCKLSQVMLHVYNIGRN